MCHVLGRLLVFSNAQEFKTEVDADIFDIRFPLNEVDNEELLFDDVLLIEDCLGLGLKFSFEEL